MIIAIYRMETTELVQVYLLGRWQPWGQKHQGSDRSETSDKVPTLCINIDSCRLRLSCNVSHPK